MNSTDLRTEEKIDASGGGLITVKSIDQTNCGYKAEEKMLARAVGGDLRDIKNILGYLNSSHSDVRQIMQTAIHHYEDKQLWRILLNFLAMDAWVDYLRVTSRQVMQQRLNLMDKEDLENFHQSIAEVFVIDISETECLLKESVLTEAINLSDHALLRVRHAAALMQGLRGNVDSIPVLDEIIDDEDHLDNVDWAIRAVHSLAAVDDPKCGPVMIKALAKGRGELHRSATKALGELGMKVEQAWLQALEHQDSHIRWHAARALGQCGNLRGIEVLANGLFDSNHAVRWATAGVLANIGSPAIPAILKVIVQHPVEEPYRRTVYHSLHSMQGQITKAYLDPLIQALGGSSARYEAPAIAQRMLTEWQV